jgi:hypothetical protein
MYFAMLTGDENSVKPDRMISRFLHNILDRNISTEEAVHLIQQASIILASKHPHLTPRILDYEVWNFQRHQPQPQL